VYFGRVTADSCVSVLGIRPGGGTPEFLASAEGPVTLRSVERDRLIADVPGALVGLTLPW
jgi:hypothetical protein